MAREMMSLREAGHVKSRHHAEKRLLYFVRNNKKAVGVRIKSEAGARREPQRMPDAPDFAFYASPLVFSL